MRLGLLLAALLAAACDSTQVMCGAVRDDLKRCGLPVDSLDCTRVDYGTLSAIAGRMDQKACDAPVDGDAVDPRLCALAGWACPDSPNPQVSSTATRYPLVFVSGIDDSPVFDWNPNILEALRAQGGEAHHVVLSSWMPTAARAADLADSLATLRRAAPGGKVNLICYAVAGLDCRYLVSQGGLYAGNAGARADVTAGIASITTIATPHRGTRVADAAIVALQSSTVGEVLSTLFGITDMVVPDDATLVETLRGLTVDALSSFNQTVTDDPSLPIDSFAGVSTMFAQRSDADAAVLQAQCVDDAGQPAFLRQPDTMDALNPLLLAPSVFSHTARDARGAVVSTPSDGMIAIASAKWGRFRGCLPADHYDVIGQIGNRARDPLTGFDARRFYAWLAADLAGRGL
jgi:triacylglycerol lipase